MFDALKSRAGEWGLVAAAALAGLVIWFVLNSSKIHVHILNGQPTMGWPDSWLDSLLLLPTLVAGLVVMMVPCILQMSLVFTAITAGVSASNSSASERGRITNSALAQTGLFLLGYVAFYSSLGAGLGAFGQALAVFGDTFIAAMRVVGGLLMAVLGLQLAGLLKLRIAAYCRGPAALLFGVEPKGRIGSFRAGIAFAIYCVGCCGPYIFAVLAMAAASGSIFFSAAFLVVFSLGMSIPFILIAVSRSLASRYLAVSSHRMGAISHASGALLIVFGVLMLLTNASLHA